MDDLPYIVHWAFAGTHIEDNSKLHICSYFDKTTSTCMCAFAWTINTYVLYTQHTDIEKFATLFEKFGGNAYTFDEASMQCIATHN